MPQLYSSLNVPVHFVPKPINVDYLYGRFYKEERSEKIFSYYINWNDSRKGDTDVFVDYITNKYDIPFIRENIDGWHKFLNIWPSCTFMFNLDPTAMFPGQQAMQCAALGVINIGGVNDSHAVLWPETATNDFDILEERFANYLNNFDERIRVMENAFQKVNDIYSYNSVRTRITSIIEKIV
jgi:hypothetical protein